VHSKVAKVIKGLTAAQGTKKTVDLHHGFRGISVDTITDYAFNDCYDLLDRPDWGEEFFGEVRQLGAAVWFFQQWPGLQPIAGAIPYWLAKRLSVPLGNFMKLQMECHDHIVDIKARKDAGKSAERKTIFDQLLDENATEGHVVPTVEQLTDEAYTILSAASETSGNAMTMACYNVLANDEIYAKVAAELEAAFPDPNQKIDYISLEGLPYLVRSLEFIILVVELTSTRSLP
jgi:cytochrome P450